MKKQEKKILDLLEKPTNNREKENIAMILTQEKISKRKNR